MGMKISCCCILLCLLLYSQSLYCVRYGRSRGYSSRSYSSSRQSSRPSGSSYQRSSPSATRWNSGTTRNQYSYPASSGLSGSNRPSHTMFNSFGNNQASSGLSRGSSWHKVSNKPLESPKSWPNPRPKSNPKPSYPGSTGLSGNGQSRQVSSSLAKPAQKVESTSSKGGVFSWFSGLFSSKPKPAATPAIKPSYTSPVTSSRNGFQNGNKDPSYPSSNSGLSGSGPSNYNIQNRPDTNPILTNGPSGVLTGKINPSYTSSGTGLPNANKDHGYPVSNSGLSGSGPSNNNRQNSGTYPNLNSPVNVNNVRVTNPGTNPNINSAPVNINNVKVTNTQYQPQPAYGGPINQNIHIHNHGSPSYIHTPGIASSYSWSPGYYSGIYSPVAAHHVYVHQYSVSSSPFSDLLTGLAIYNLGRAEGRLHDHYYHDDYYYRHRPIYNDYSPQPAPSHNTYNNYHTENIYVSNTENNNNYNLSQNNNNNTQNAPATTNVQPNSAEPVVNATCALSVQIDGEKNVLRVPCDIVSSFINDNSTKQSSKSSSLPLCATFTSSTPSDKFANTGASQQFGNIVTQNGVQCINATDPLSVQAPQADLSHSNNMKCEVIITTANETTTKEIDCNVLKESSKKKEEFLEAEKQMNEKANEGRPVPA